MGASMYTPTMVEVVLVDALRHLGMSPSSVLAFLLGGPMISIPSMMAVSRIVGVEVGAVTRCVGCFRCYCCWPILPVCWRCLMGIAS